MAERDRASEGERQRDTTGASILSQGQRGNGANGTNGHRRFGTPLGIAGIGMGLAELAAPGAVGRAIGIGDRPARRLAMRLMGVRDLALAIGGLGRYRPQPWLWARVAGDLGDLAFMAWTLRSLRKRPFRRRSSRLPLALGVLAGVAILDTVTAVRATRAARALPRQRWHEQPRVALTIDRMPEEVYDFLRDPQNLRRFVSNIESVRELASDRLELTFHRPLGRSFRCLVNVVDDTRGRSLTWIASTESGGAFCSGSVRLARAPGERGTEIRLALDTQEGPGGALGAAILRLWSKEKVRNDLRRLKQLIELGHLAESDASIHRGPHPARPSARREVLPPSLT